MSVVVEMPKRGAGRPKGYAKTGGRQKGTGNLVAHATKETAKSLLDGRGHALVQRAVNLALGMRMRVGPAAGPNPVYAYPSEATQAKMLELCLRKLLPDLKSEEIAATNLNVNAEATDTGVVNIRQLARSLLAGVAIDQHGDEAGDDADLTGDLDGAALRTAAAALGDDGEDDDDGGGLKRGHGPATGADSLGPNPPHLHSAEKNSSGKNSKNSEVAADDPLASARSGSPLSGSAAPFSSGDDTSPRRMGLAGGASVALPTASGRPPNGWQVEEATLAEGTQAGQRVFNIYDPAGEHKGRRYTRDDAVALAKKFAAEDIASGRTPVKRAPAPHSGLAEEGERILYGERGGWLELRERAGDGRERWAICDANGTFQGVKWGKEAAEAEAERLIALGKI